jgi:thiol-disulfide isomerase/thioredoxin
VTDPAPPEAAPAAPEKPEIEEGKNDVVGVMAAASSWIVPGWVKAVCFWFSLVAIGALVYEQLDKRHEFRTLLVDSVVEPEPWPRKSVKKPAPDFTLKKGPDGGDLALSSLKGKWVLINFWATWCPPCRDEMPSLEMLTRRLARDHAGKIELVAASVDEDWNEVNRFFGQTKPTFTVVWDREKSAANSYDSRKFPETYLVAPDGTVAAKFTGPRDWYNQGMVQYFDEVLRGIRPPTS